MSQKSNKSRQRELHTNIIKKYLIATHISPLFHSQEQKKLLRLLLRPVIIIIIKNSLYLIFLLTTLTWRTKNKNKKGFVSAFLKVNKLTCRHFKLFLLWGSWKCQKNFILEKAIFLAQIITKFFSRLNQKNFFVSFSRDKRIEKIKILSRQKLICGWNVSQVSFLFYLFSTKSFQRQLLCAEKNHL